MASTSKPNKYGKKINIERTPRQVKPKVTVSVLVKLQLIGFTDKYVYTTNDGNRVVWSGAGSVNAVSREDANYLLTKQKVGSCCGGSPQRKPIFSEIT